MPNLVNYNFSVSPFELVVATREVGDKVIWPKDMRTDSRKKES